ncbi:MAG: TIGR03905 family TSCPD domain-containing protein [Oscillibacter sp.]|nr:TIGR03905 family TSCPD domain-containing protein [Oscillibacter sp.]
MMYRFRPRGVCSQEMLVEVDEQGVVQSMQVYGGCSGNLQGISALVKGMPVQEVVQRLKGIRCGFKDTSCPDQLARNLERALEQK